MTAGFTVAHIMSMENLAGVVYRGLVFGVSFSHDGLVSVMPWAKDKK